MAESKAEKFKRIDLESRRLLNEGNYLEEVNQIKTNRGIMPITMQVAKASKEKKARDADLAQFKDMPAERYMELRMQEIIERWTETKAELEQEMRETQDPEEIERLTVRLRSVDEMLSYTPDQTVDRMIWEAEMLTTHEKVEIGRFSLAESIGISEFYLDDFVSGLNDSKIVSALSPDQIEEIAFQVKSQFSKELKANKIHNAINYSLDAATSLTVLTGLLIGAAGITGFAMNGSLDSMHTGFAGLGIAGAGVFVLRPLLDKLSDKLYEKSQVKEGDKVTVDGSEYQAEGM